jgi:Uma2 family endonuclease
MATLPATVQRKLFTVAEYEQMVSAGVLHEDDRLELIEGEIVEMSPIGGLHMQVVNLLTQLLIQQLQGRAVVSVQNPIRLNKSEPQPDFALLRPQAARRAIVPSATDVLLVIEVSDTTIEHDRHTKARLYATNGVPETWLINLPEQTIEIYREPVAGRYRSAQTLSGAEVATPQLLTGVQLRVADLFDTP